MHRGAMLVGAQEASSAIHAREVKGQEPGEVYSLVFVVGCDLWG
jgi:hypothetical protein